jgi:predicted metal-dependent hydrolase
MPPMSPALFRRPPDPATIEVAFDRTTYLVRLRRSRGARRYTLRIQAATREVLLTMPLRGSLADAKAFAQKNGGWIATRLNRLPEPAPFVDGTIVPLRGRPHRIVHRPGARGTVWAEIVDEEALLCVAGAAPHVSRRVADYLKREAKRDLDAASRRYAGALGAAVARVTVRDTSSRWGSCSATGALSFSWRLILAPPHVLDYLAAHETAHLLELSHAPRFWRIVRGICPEMDRAKAWLDAHGADLHRYGSSRQ